MPLSWHFVDFAPDDAVDLFDLADFRNTFHIPSLTATRLSHLAALLPFHASRLTPLSFTATILTLTLATPSPHLTYVR